MNSSWERPLSASKSTFAGTYRLRVQALGYVATAAFTVGRESLPIDPLPDK